jgi:hypothetical protein
MSRVVLLDRGARPDLGMQVIASDPLPRPRAQPAVARSSSARSHPSSRDAATSDIAT